jgi:hypothetical protein
MSALHPADDEPMSAGHRRAAGDLSDGIEILGDSSVVDLELVRQRPRPERARSGTRARRRRDADIEVIDVEPTRPVFAGAAAYRPIVVAVAVASALCIVYGVLAITFLLLPSGSNPSASTSLAASPAREIIGSTGSVATTSRCDAVDGVVFDDGDANGVRNPWDPDHDFSGTQVEIHGADGFRSVRTTDAAGRWSTDLPRTGPSMVAVRGLDALAAQGLWPGPRQLAHTGEFSMIGETCTSDLGLVWIPLGVGPPALADTTVPPPTPVDDGGAVQVHGRVWIDVDGDGRFQIEEPAGRGIGLVLRDTDGTVVGTATSGEDGLYAFANLAPSTRYALSVAGEDTVVAARFLGEDLDDPARPVVFDTGASDLAVWGVDFALGAPDPEDEAVDGATIDAGSDDDADDEPPSHRERRAARRQAERARAALAGVAS